VAAGIGCERDQKENKMVPGMSREEFVARLVRAGELEVSGENPDEVDGYFSPDFTFHGPGGWEAGYDRLQKYFQSWRSAFDNRKITRGIVVVEGNYIACQTTMEGDFVREFTQSPVGSLPPNGQHVVFELINIFRYDDEGRIVDESVQIDNHTLLQQLGAAGS
jgi:predicted ester cyclase